VYYRNVYLGNINKKEVYDFNEEGRNYLKLNRKNIFQTEKKGKSGLT
jgi:hypothetical protein